MSLTYPVAWPHNIPRAASQRAPAVDQSPKLAYQYCKQRMKEVGASNVVVTTSLKVGRMGEVFNTVSSDPAAVVQFEHKYLPQTARVPCSLYATTAANIQAATDLVVQLLSLQRLTGPEQFLLLMAPYMGVAQSAVEKDGPINWRRVLGLSLVDPVTLEDAELAYRRKRKAAHSDHGGSTDAFDALQKAIEAARKVLRK